MALINPNINLNGNAEGAFHFYKSIFGEEIVMIQRFKNIGYNEFLIPASEANKITHIPLPFGKNILKGNAVPESMVELMKMKTGLKFLLAL